MDSIGMAETIGSLLGGAVALVSFGAWLRPKAERFFSPLHRFYRPLKSGNLHIFISALHSPAVLTTGTSSREVAAGPSGLVHAPLLFTGINDALTIGRLHKSLTQLGIKHSFTPAPTSITEYETGLRGNVICIGAPSSNAVTGYLIRRLQSEYGRDYGFDERASRIMLRGQLHPQPSEERGNLALFAKDINPADPKQWVVILAGIGPTGTEAAGIMATEKVDKLWECSKGKPVACLVLGRVAATSERWAAVGDAEMIDHEVFK